MSRYCRGCGQSDCVCGIGLWVNSCETIPCPTCPDLKPGLKAPEDCPDCEGAGVIERWDPPVPETPLDNLSAQAKRAGLPVEQLRADDLAEHLADRVLELEKRLAEQSKKLLAVANENALMAAVLKRYDEDRRGDGFRNAMQRMQDEDLLVRERNAAVFALEAARVAVGKLGRYQLDRLSDPVEIAANNANLAALRLALGLEAKP
jgi:hypothetical protein